MSEAVAGKVVGKVVELKTAAPSAQTAQTLFSQCRHGEIIYDDGRPAYLKHDCAYTDRRNKLIPAAEGEAYAAAGRRPAISAAASLEALRAYEGWTQAWNRAFHAAMDRLSRDQEVGLVTSKQ